MALPDRCRLVTRDGWPALLHETARWPSCVRLTGPVVVGAGAGVEEGIEAELGRVVLLPGVLLRAGELLADAIVSPSGILAGR